MAQRSALEQRDPGPKVGLGVKLDRTKEGKLAAEQVDRAHGLVDQVVADFCERAVGGGLNALGDVAVFRMAGKHVTQWRGYARGLYRYQ